MSSPVTPPLGPPAPPTAPSLGVTPTGTDWRAKGFDFAADGTKQLITVATGVLTAAVIFSKDINPNARWWALGAWGFLTFSVLCGIFVLLSISGHLTRTANTLPPPSAIPVALDNPDSYALPNLYRRDIRILSITQCFSFLIGLAVFVYLRIPGNRASDRGPQTGSDGVPCDDYGAARATTITATTQHACSIETHSKKG